MDLHLTAARATDEERRAVTGVLGPEEARSEVLRTAVGGHADRGRRHLLLPVLHAVQRRIGWISEGAVNHVAERLVVPPAEVFGVASFYALFATRPRAATVVHVCDDVACIPNGAEAVCAAAEAAFGTPGGEGATIWQRSPCLGLCERAPAVFVQRSGEAAEDAAVTSVAPADVAALGRPDLASTATSAGATAPQTSGDRSSLRLLRRVGAIDPSSIDAYRDAGGWRGLARARALGSAATIAEIEASGLLGRGGAAFPTGAKWSAVAAQPPGPRFVVANADESEPGTFKDRTLLEHDPFALVEALAIAGFAVGAERGYVYLRGEYPVAEARLAAAIAASSASGFLGPDAFGTGRGFDVELRRGAGAYICGEETALFASIEGHRGEPRSKPPFPVARGLFGSPTAINNVETLANVPWILADGADAFRAVGTEGSTGTRLFCLSGCVARPGVYEVACGTTLGELLELAGGLRDGGTLRAILLGGAAGTFVGPDLLDLRLSFEDARARGVTLGSGVVAAFDERVDLEAVVRRIASFFRDESCGQCVPCRIGTVRQEEALHRFLAGGADARVRELPLLDDVQAVMRDASICGLGQAAGQAVASAIALGLVGARS